MPLSLSFVALAVASIALMNTGYPLAGMATGVGGVLVVLMNSPTGKKISGAASAFADSYNEAYIDKED